MDYDLHEDIKFSALEPIDAGRLAAAVVSPWWNQSLCLVNQSVVRLGVFLGEFHWHAHTLEDELFFVLEGRLLLDLEDPCRTVELAPMQGMLVPRGARHRTRAEVRTVVLMVEAATVRSTGDQGACR